MIPGSANPLLLASAEADAYEIERSLRFNSSDSAYLSDTFGSPTDQDVFTFALWVKRATLNTTQQLFGVSTNHSFGFTSGNALNLTFGGSSALTTTAVFRDPSAWYHIVWKQSGTSHTLYVNNVSVGTATATSSVFNTAVAHQIGAANTTSFFNGYLADIHFIDGQALDPTSFGKFDTNGIWQPKAYTGSYGTNGFHLDFADNSTAAALGTDTSGNSNTWTINNISVTAGAGNDSLVDVPTNGTETDTGVGGEVRGNYCTLNLLGAAGAAPTNGNLSVSPSSTVGNRISTFFLTSGKWYWEGMGNGYVGAIIGAAGASYTGSVSAASSAAIGYWDGGLAYWDGGRSGTGSSYLPTDVIGVALDMDAGNVKFYKNNALIHDLTFGSGTIPDLSSGVYPGYNVGAGTKFVDFNFGQRPFAYTAPSGFKALCTANLPSTTITTSGSYTGNGVADGPFVYLNGVPTAMTIGGNSVTFGTDADKLSNGFKIRTTSTTYNQNASTYNYTITSTGDPFKTARAQNN